MFEGVNRVPGFLQPVRFGLCNRGRYCGAGLHGSPLTDLVGKVVLGLHGAMRPEVVTVLRHQVLAAAVRDVYPNSSHDSSR